MGFPLYVTCCFSLAAFNILSLCLVLVSLISMCLGMFLLGFSFVAQLVKNPPAMQETLIQSLGQEDPLEKGKATHFSILAWRIP